MANTGIEKNDIS